jgi:PAS domain S-box-containing protein
MKDQNKTKKQLINELVALRLRIAELGALENEHKRLEEALEQLAAIVQSSDDAIIGKTLGGMIISWNSGAERVYGYSSVEVVGRHMSILLPPNHPDEVSQFLERISRGERIDHYETVRMRKDGQLIYVSLTISPIKDATGKIVGASTVARDISGHKRMEEALRESEGRLRIILESVQTGIVIIDPETHRIIDANSVAVKLIGAPKEQIIGSGCHRYICPAEKGRCPITDLGQIVDNKERVLLTAGGEICPIIKTVVPVMLGGREHLLESFIDITERKRTEEALRESENKYRKIFENVQDVFYQADNGGNIIDISPSIERYSGYTREELIGKPVGKIYFNPQDRITLLKAIGEKGEVVDYEVRLKSKDNRLIYTSVNTHILLDSAGKPIGVEGTLRDITERKRAEEALQESEERYRALVESSTDAILMLDKERKIISSNQAFLDLFGYEKSEIEGKSIRIIHPSDDSFKSFGDLAYPTIEKVGFFRAEWDFIRKGAMPFVAETVTSVIRSTAGATVGFVSIIRDITERKRTEEALVRQHSELEILNETKDRFLGIAAHDLRNPLTVVDVSTQILKKNTTEPIHLTLLNNIGRSTQKMLALINAFLDVSKIQSGKLEIRPEDVDVAQFLRECYDENEMIGRQKGIASVLSVPEDIGYARFDKERMHQAVDNLLSNAFKYSNPNTTVTLGAKRSDRGLEIRVEDQGVGIEDEDLPLLFEEFSKASAQPTGGESSHGLGLAIVKRVVELQGGRIEAKSNPGGGAVFTITLP